MQLLLCLQSLPQTPAGSLAAKAIVGGAAGGPSSGMVNGSDHRDLKDAAEQHVSTFKPVLSKKFILIINNFFFFAQLTNVLY